MAPGQPLPLSTAARGCAWAAIAIGATVLCGYLFGVERLEHIHGGFPAMVPNSALMIVATGAAILAALRRPARAGGRTAAALAGLVAAIAAATLVEHVAGADLHIDRLLGTPINPGPHPGRPAPPTASVLLVLSASLLALRSRRPWVETVGAGLSWFAGLVCEIVAVGYLLGVDELKSISSVTGMAVHTVVACSLLTAAVFCLRPDRAPGSWYARDDAGSISGRHVLPWAIGLPLAAAIVVDQGSARDGWSHDLALSILAIASLVVAQGLIAAMVRIVREHERGRRDAELELARLVETLPDSIVGVDAQGRIALVNAEATRAFGYEREEMLGKPIELLVPGRFAHRHHRDRDRYLETPHTRPMAEGVDLSARRKDGSEFPAEISLSPTTAGGRVRVTAIIRDVTVRRRLEERNRQMIDRIAEAVALFGPDGVVLHTNVAGQAIIDDLQARRAAAGASRPIVHADGTPLAEEEDPVATTRRTGVEVTGEVVGYPDEDGNLRWLRISSRRLDDGPAPYTVIASLTDVTDERARDRALADAEARLRTMFDTAPIGMFLLSLDGRIVTVNRSFSDLLGHPPEHLVGTPIFAFTHAEDLDESEEHFARLVGGEVASYRIEKRYMNARGEPLWAQSDLTLLRDAEGVATFALGQIQDVTARRQYEEQLLHFADHDALTGLLNRRGLARELDRQCAYAERYGASGALLLLDLDHFKMVNDSLGHKAGDELIVEVAELLRHRVRRSDVVARLGGDEFAVLLANATLQEASHVAESILGALRNRTPASRRQGRITASVGIAPFAGAVAGDELLMRADLAMYDAKDAGRDQWAVYADTEHDRPRTLARITWLERIRHALEEDGLRLFAQPIADPHDGRPVMHELLLRLLGDDGDLMPPATFLYIAERFDLIQQIDRWVVRQACELLGSAHGAGHDLTLTVNVSGKSMGDELADVLAAELARTGARPHDLILEITETAAVAHMHEARLFAQRVHDLGCRLAIDDFGAGFGSFYYLKHLPFDFLKIDGEFVSNALQSRPDALIVDAVRDLAHGMRGRVIAEFCCDEELCVWLRDRGIDLVQGYHVGRPRPVEDVLAELAAPPAVTDAVHD